MIIGKNETNQCSIRPFLYHQKSSFFSLEDFINNNDNETSEAVNEERPSKTMIPPIVVANSVKTLPQLSNSSDRNRESLISDWPRIINEQIHLNYLKKQQAEQLKPFFLTKSKFVSKKGRTPSRRTARSKTRKSTDEPQIEVAVIKEEEKEELIDVIEITEKSDDKMVGMVTFSEDVPTYSPEEIELINESKEKCNNWLEKHVLKYCNINTGFKP